MRLIPVRFGNDWSKQIDGIVGGRTPLTDAYNYNPNFPWEDVQECTTQYIISKKARAIPGLSDERLIKLVQKSDRKDIALAACVHLLSPAAVRTLLVGDFTRLDLIIYLQLICIGHHGCPNAVGELEADRARAILVATQDQNQTVDGQYLRALFAIIQKGIPKTSLVFPTLQTATTCAISMVAAELAVLRQNYQWHRAWKMVSWISVIPSIAANVPANFLDPIELLDRNFRTWRMWAAWEPSESKSSEYRYSDVQCDAIREYLALEGPDDQPNPKTNVCERLMAQTIDIKSKVAHIGNIRLSLQEGTQNEARAMLARLLSCNGRIFRGGTTNVEIFIVLLVGKFITTESLDVLDAVAATTEWSVLLLVCSLYKSLPVGKNILKDAKIALPLLRTSGCERLKMSGFGKLVVEILMVIINDLQEKLQNIWGSPELESGTSTEVRMVLELHSEVTRLRDDAADLPWLTGLVGEPFMELVHNWPASDEFPTLLNMRRDVCAIGGPSANRLVLKIVDYLKDQYLRRGSIDEQTRSMVKALISFWKNASDTYYQQAVILLADGGGKFRLDCIAGIYHLSYKDVKEIIQILKNWSEPGNGQNLACDHLAQFLVSYDSEFADDVVPLWRPVLYRMLKQRGTELLERALHTWSVGQYVTFLCNIQKIFRDKTVWKPKLSPPILEPSLYEWADRLQSHMPVILRLQTKKGSISALRCLKAGSEPWILEGILYHLELEDCWLEKTAMFEASYGIAGLLSPESDNAQEVYDVLCSIYQISIGAAAACVRLLGLCHDGQMDVASVLLSAWLQDSSWSEYDQMGFRDVARLLQIVDDGLTGVSTTTLETVANYMDKRYADLFVEARRLDIMRIALKSKDSEGISQLLYDNKIEDATSIEDSFARLPIELLNVVENVDFSEVEILFPLNDITPLQRAAMGIGMAQSLLVRLYIGDYGSPPKFCIHLDNEPRLDSHDVHSQWVVYRGVRAPELPICHGKITPATYQLSRILSRYLVVGFQDILSIHTLISKALKAMGQECLVCGAHHGATLRRATICDAWECAHIFSRSPVDIRLADIREDPLAVDMLLTTIHSAINAGHHNILPNCPFDQTTCLTILRTIPAMERLAKSKHLWATMQNWHNGKSEQFLSWAICSFRGFLSSATGNLRIPSLPPGTLQFVLANASPLKELAFATEFATNAQQSRVMFHGTSLDRVFLIMHQGLKNMSGTPLQAYGAASGPGIYLADDPTTSWGYADRRGAKSANWANSAIKIGRILLACELTAPLSVRTNTIYVTQKEESVMVRYIFVVPSATERMPIPGHINPALMSVYNSLRSGAL